MNKRLALSILPALALALLAGLMLHEPAPVAAAMQPEFTPTPTATQVSSATATSTATSIPPTETPESGRPIVVVESYGVDSAPPGPGSEFTLRFRLANTGRSKARSVVASFGAGDFIPGGNGGVVSAGTLAAGASSGFSQSMFASSALTNGSIGLINLTVSYTDEAGTAYSESFNLGVAIGAPTRSPGSGVRVGTPTPTPTIVPRPLLIVVNHQSEPSHLQPGTEFELTLRVHNFGGSRAERISMVLGSVAAPSGNPSNGEGSGGSSGDFTAFAPLGSSNIQFLGDLEAGDTFSPTQQMIVSGTTKAGVHVVHLTFNYTDDKGKSFGDQQVITLLVQTAPLVEVSFYRPLEPLFAGQPISLPIQVVNLQRSSVQLGRMQVTANGSPLENGEAMIGYLDPGGYFTLDPMFFPDVAGEIAVQVHIGYVDDFNRSQTLLRELMLNVEAMPELPEEFPPPGEGGPIDDSPGASETGFWGTLWRALLGLLGLDSRLPSDPGLVQGGEAPPIEIIVGPQG